jgi:RimJ/RimL family protein N-acetyltransferase
MAEEWRTERMLLRRFAAADADRLIALDSDPAVMQFLSGGTPTPPAVIVQEILPRFIRSATQPAPRGYWAALEPAAGRFLGWFGLRREEHDPAVAHLGYRLCRAAWGQGYATEGAHALVSCAFAEGGLHRIVATTYEDNLASR